MSVPEREHAVLVGGPRDGSEVMLTAAQARHGVWLVPEIRSPFLEWLDTDPELPTEPMIMSAEYRAVVDPMGYYSRDDAGRIRFQYIPRRTGQ